MRGDAESPSGYEQEEPAAAAVLECSDLSVQVQPKEDAFQDGAHVMQKLILQENVDDKAKGKE
jgi:hypothetical protein